MLGQASVPMKRGWIAHCSCVDQQRAVRTRPSVVSTQVARTSRRSETRSKGITALPEASLAGAQLVLALLFEVVADYKRLSVLAAGRPGHGQASGPQYPDVSIGYITR